MSAPCPMRLQLNGVPCGCGGFQPSHYPEHHESAAIVQALTWEEVRDCAVAIAEDRLRRGVLTAREIRDALDLAYQRGREAA